MVPAANGELSSKLVSACIDEKLRPEGRRLREPAVMPRKESEPREPRKPRKTDPGAEVLVRLREEGDKPPLYFIPAGHGDMRTFRDIVALLDDDRPIYGLWPPKAELVEGLRNKPVHWLVSVYIAEIRRVQPAGPYHLSGYSAGGLAMTAVARELVRQGDTVDILILFDPPVYIPRWIDLWFKMLLQPVQPDATDRRDPLDTHSPLGQPASALGIGRRLVYPCLGSPLS